MMPLCKGDDSGLLFHFYYPTEATPDSGYQYVAWLPNELYHKFYAKGYNHEDQMLAKGQYMEVVLFDHVTHLLILLQDQKLQHFLEHQ